jgi:hypothetical protein
MHVYRMNERWRIGRGAAEGREGGGRGRGCPKRDERLKSGRHNDLAICSASVHNDGDHTQQKISMPIGISFN